MAGRKLTDAELKTNVADIESFFAEQRDANTAPAWMPKAKGDRFRGVVIARAMRESRDPRWGLYPMITYRVLDMVTGEPTGETVALHAFHQLMRARLKELGTIEGMDQIHEYLGVQVKNNATDEERAEGKDTYHNYYSVNTEDLLKEKPTTSENFTF